MNAMVIGDYMEGLTLEADTHLAYQSPPTLAGQQYDGCFYIRPTNDVDGMGEWYCYSLHRNNNNNNGDDLMMILGDQRQARIVSMLEKDADDPLSTVAVINSCIHKFGDLRKLGMSGDVSFLDPNNSRRPSWRKTPPMIKGRCHPQVASLDGSIYVFGGVADERTSGYDSKNLWPEVLRPGAAKWELLLSSRDTEFKSHDFFVWDTPLCL